jgi:hypothetical protein
MLLIPDSLLQNAWFLKEERKCADPTHFGDHNISFHVCVCVCVCAGLKRGQMEPRPVANTFKNHIFCYLNNLHEYR